MGTEQVESGGRWTETSGRFVDFDSWVLVDTTVCILASLELNHYVYPSQVLWHIELEERVFLERLLGNNGRHTVVPLNPNTDTCRLTQGGPIPLCRATRV